jgi:hypothetical protein
MAGLLELKRSATESCALRGHAMEWSNPYHGESRSVQSAACRFCQMEVHISTRPDANGIDIGGEAVALNCDPVEAWAEANGA